jgi:CPA1 family monovalent cation:H+ antiporter
VVLTLAVGATLLGALLIGLALDPLLALLGVGLGLVYALVFGALISPADPIAVRAILGKVGLPPRLEAVLNGEFLVQGLSIGRLFGAGRLASLLR